MPVAAIEEGKKDAAGAPIKTVYAKRPPDYAVYRTDTRVMVHYADDGVIEKSQRVAMAPLNPVRGEINGLVDGWRTSRWQGLTANARRYDRRVADALVACLEDDCTGALSLLEAIKKDIVEERISWARFQYLLIASLTVLMIIALCVLGMHVFDASQKVLHTLLFAGGTGAVGALFSIAIAIRSRTVLPDLRFRDNSADAVLRIWIGTIAAALLICLLRSKAIDFQVGQARLDPNEPGASLFTLIVAFLGGFSERLVPDLLGKFAAGGTNGPAPQPAGATPGAPGAPARPPLAATPATVVLATPDPANRVDHCICDAAVQPDEATPDTELPPASGGVAAPRS
jgi:hypothetical protein